MNPDDKICLCFHVSRRKIKSFIRVEKPRRPSQLSECFGAGTGCGWCRPFLKRMLDAELGYDSDAFPGTPITESEKPEGLTSEDYAAARAAYIEEGKGTPPTGS